MIKILLKLWPAYIPFILFGIWYLYNKRKYKDVKVYDEFLEKRNRYAYIALLATGVLIILSLLYIALTQEPTTRLEMQGDQVLNKVEQQ